MAYNALASGGWEGGGDVTLFKELADTREASSLSTKLRRKRFALFKSLTASIPRPFRMLDVGGSQTFWENMGMCEESGLEIWILDLTQRQPRHPNIKCIPGDGRDIWQFRDREFDVVFSNSVLEHVGGYAANRCSQQTLKASLAGSAG
jgi:hypothetical protein